MTNYFSLYSNYSLSSFKQCPYCFSGSVLYNETRGYYCTKCGKTESYHNEWTASLLEKNRNIKLENDIYEYIKTNENTTYNNIDQHFSLPGYVMLKSLCRLIYDNKVEKLKLNDIYVYYVTSYNKQE